MAERRNPYEVLGVARDADENTIRTSYRRLARKYHPDVNPGDTEAENRFKEISEAYAVLSDTEKRRAYDEFGDVSLDAGFDAEAARRAREQFGARFGTGFGEQPGGPGGFRDAGAEGFHFDDLEDLLGNVFGGRRGRPMPRRSPDLEAELRLGLREAALGSEQRGTLTRPTPDGAARQETVTVRVPPGMTDGSRIRLAGKGAEFPGAAAGDLFVTIRVAPHPVFRVDGRDLQVEVPVSVGEATLGAKIEVPTLEGRATLTIPAGTDGGQRLRLRGKGLPGLRGSSAGDLYVTIRIRVPRDLDPRGREYVEGLAAYEPSDLRKGLFE